MQQDALLQEIQPAWERFEREYSQRRPPRQPVHTLYGGAQLFKAETATKMGKTALRILDAYAPNFVYLAQAAGLNGHAQMPQSWEAAEALQAALLEMPEAALRLNPEAAHLFSIYQRVRAKLEREALEDFRIDFEDGYGPRPDEEEDKDARRTAQEIIKGLKENSLPPFIGIRIKPWVRESTARSVRTLKLFLEALLEGGEIPPHFVITLPKVCTPEEPRLLDQWLSDFEKEHGLTEGVLQTELMVETTQSLVALDGSWLLPQLFQAAGARCRGAHFGTYDYTASVGLIAQHQQMDHPACDFARHSMQVALGGTGLMLSDGATNIMPVPVHSGDNLNLIQQQENLHSVHQAWRLHADHIRHSLRHGYYQGWDLHPGQLITRYATLYDFFLKELPQASQRMQNFLSKAAQATLSGDVFDDAATGKGLMNYFRQAYVCGAITPEEVSTAGLEASALVDPNRSLAQYWNELTGQDK